MKQGQPLRRRKPLLPNPHRVKEWNRKARDPVARASLGGPQRRLARSRPQRHPEVPPEVRKAVRARSHGRCIVCLFDGKARAGKAEHLHHGLPKADNPINGWPELRCEADNLMGICDGCHDAHERASRRIPREALPQCFTALCVRLGGRALAYLESHYPTAAERAA